VGPCLTGEPSRSVGARRFEGRTKGKRKKEKGKKKKKKGSAFAFLPFPLTYLGRAINPDEGGEKGGKGKGSAGEFRTTTAGTRNRCTFMDYRVADRGTK